MADNVSIRDSAALTFNAATDELSDTSQSPKVTLLAGDGSPTPIDPRQLIGQPGSQYETVAASQTNQALGATGGSDDLINGILVIPATTSPGAITLKDGATSIAVFTGGATSVSNLVPFFIPLGIRSVSGAWSLTTGAAVSCIAVGDFTA
jgi:hypothetical protein